MTDFLIRIFVKNYTDTSNKKVRESYGVFSAVVCIICNFFLFLSKLVTGILINSVSVMADSINNLSDIGSNSVTLVGFKTSASPPDKEHPFGHGRIEYIAAFIMSVIIMLVGIELLKSSVDGIINPEKVNFSIVSLVILILSIAVKLWMSFLTKKIGKKINSIALEAAAFDSISDSISTLAIIISLIIGAVFNINIDGYIGSLVALFVCYGGIRIAINSVNPLLGEAIDYETDDKIKKIALSYEEVKGAHDLIIHNYGPGMRMATLHIELPSSMGFAQSHELLDKMEQDIYNSLGVMVVTHGDPVIIGDNETDYYSEVVDNIIIKIDPAINKHDFRIVRGEARKILVFDIELPYSYSSKKGKDIIKKINENVNEIDNNVYCSINVDRSFTKEVDKESLNNNTH